MAKALNPAYVRISGPECNYFTFRGAQDTAQSSPVHPIKHGKNNITITGWHWSQLNEFVAKTGLELVVGLNVMNRQHGKWDLGNTLDLVSYSDKHGYNMAFQLGNGKFSFKSSTYKPPVRLNIGDDDKYSLRNSLILLIV